MKRAFDYQTQPAFGVLCVQETLVGIECLLQIDFDDYFVSVSE